MPEVALYPRFFKIYCGIGADPFGYPTLIRPWEDGDDPMEVAKARMKAAFEFFSKLGIKYWTFHDRLAFYSVCLSVCLWYVYGMSLFQ